MQADLAWCGMRPKRSVVSISAAAGVPILIAAVIAYPLTLLVLISIVLIYAMHIPSKYPQEERNDREPKLNDSGKAIGIRRRGEHSFLTIENENPRLE